MGKILVTYKIPEAGITILKAAGHTVTVRKSTTLIPREELLQAVKEYDALLVLLTEKIDGELLAAAGPQLKIIANYAVGYDNMDVPAAREKGIILTNTPDVLNDAVAEHTMALIVSLSRRIVEADTFTRAGRYTGWRPELFLGVELKGKVLGIIGAGRIGREVARRARFGFEMHIAYTDMKPDAALDREFSATYYSSVDELLPVADVVSLHVPLVPATHHLINEQRLAQMKKTALLINTARGGVIDEAALVKALTEKTLAGAALDVFESEPALSPGLVQLSNVTLTPHIASATQETRSAMAELAARNIVAVLAGQKPLTPVQ